MDDDQVDLAVDEIERVLLIDDPGYVRRVRKMHRDDNIYVAMVFVALAIGAMLLTIGLGTGSATLWASGIGALVVAVVVDERRKRTLR